MEWITLLQAEAGRITFFKAPQLENRKLGVPVSLEHPFQNIGPAQLLGIMKCLKSSKERSGTMLCGICNSILCGHLQGFQANLFIQLFSKIPNSPDFSEPSRSARRSSGSSLLHAQSPRFNTPGSPAERYYGVYRQEK